MAEHDDKRRLTPEEHARLRPLLYHTVPAAIQEAMASLRADFLALALRVLREEPASRAQSLALTALEEAQMRAIQGLAMQGRPQLPPGFVIEGFEEATP
jgi:hypothetical protein